MRVRYHRGGWPLAVLLMLVACQSTPPIEPTTDVARKHVNAVRYLLDGEQSRVTLKVYRDGPLARFGHNHVITATQISGTVYREREPMQSGVELTIPVQAFEVDRADAREQAGADFPGPLPPEAIAGTRQNMLGPKVLAAAQYPHIVLQTLALSGQWPNPVLTVEVKLREFTRVVSIPVRISESGDRIVATGELTLSQTQLGLTPYSVLGGGLRVRDNIDVTFHLVAKRHAAKN